MFLKINVIGSFGLMEVNMLGDDEFDGDDEEDEWCTVQNAPFDVEGLLNKDLKGDDDVAGWFKDMLITSVHSNVTKRVTRHF